MKTTEELQTKHKTAVTAHEIVDALESSLIKRAESPKSFKKVGFIGLFLSVVAIFFIAPVFMTNYYANLVLQMCFATLTLSSIYTLSNERAVFIMGPLIALPFLTFDALSIYTNSLSLMVVSYGFFVIFLLFTMYTIAKRVFKKTQITTNLIFGAISMYLLAGILWAKLYCITQVVYPGSFHGIPSIVFANGELEKAYANQFDLLYYSFTTLASLGIGDITPVHHLAKSLTTLEAIFGQLFIATVIARMVSLWHKEAN